MKLSIREMTRADKEAVMCILKRTPEFNVLDVGVAEEVIESYLAAPETSGYYAFVAEVEGMVIGYITYGPAPLTLGTWDIYWIATDSEFRGRGVGTTLMHWAEERISQAGGRLILIETSGRAEYEATRRFYEKLGYREVSRIIDFYALGDDLVTFEKRFNRS